MNKTIAETQINFVVNQDLKEQAMAKAKKDGITLKALFVMAMKSYVNNELAIGITREDDFYDDIFADKDIVKKANRLGQVLGKI